MKARITDWGPWALITGASTGLGLEFANQLAAQGLNLLLVSRNAEQIEQVAVSLRGRWGVEARGLSLDLSRPNAIDQLMAWVGHVDVGLVISNAGAGRPSAFLDLTEEEISHSFQLNGQTHAELAHRFGRRLLARGKGAFLMVAAMGAQHGIPYMAADAAAKSVVISLGRALHQEWKAGGVHVTVLSPGPTETPVIAKLGFDVLALPLKPATAANCVQEGLGALLKNRPHHVSGRFFRLMGMILPPTLWTAINGTMLKKASQIVASRKRSFGTDHLH